MRTLVVFVLVSIVNITCAFNLFSARTTSPAVAATLKASSNHDEQTETTTTVMNRRSILMSLLAVGTASTLGIGGPSMIVQAENTVPAVVATTDLESVYFGVGCFWHIQHEFIVAERELLGRSDRQLTAFTGYAGGTAADSFGRVCYHNFQNVADYGKYGHGEVVGMKLPTDNIVNFAKLYFSLYDPKTLGKYMNNIILLVKLILYFASFF